MRGREKLGGVRDCKLSRSVNCEKGETLGGVSCKRM